MMAHVYFEVTWNGQTPGKRILGLRTVRAKSQRLRLRPRLRRSALCREARQ